MPHPKVMIVDDNETNIAIFSLLFEEDGFSVETALNGAQALERLKVCDDIDIVFMDVMMPVMDGYDTTRAIRSDPKYKDIPIIAITADYRNGVKQRCLHAGVTDFLPKPIDPDVLLGVGHQWVDG